MNMTWYSAKLLFESEVDGENDQPLREESIRVLLSESEAEARAKAAEVGTEAEHEYLNEQGQKVRWRFVAVLEVQDLCADALTDGMEVFSVLFRTPPN